MKLYRHCIPPGILCASLIAGHLHAQVAIELDDDPPHFSSTTTFHEGVVVFMYHGLNEEHGWNPASFDAQMQYLADNGFNTITLDHLKNWIETGSPALPSRPIVLTFDDVYESVYTVAYPALKQHGFTGVNFAHSNYIGVDPGETPPTSFHHVEWEECIEMEDDGVIFTESHTVWHRNLTTLTPANVTMEIYDSKAAIEAMMPDKTVRHFSYPYGGYNSTIAAEVAAAGYHTAVTTVTAIADRSTPLMEIPRYGVNPSTGSNNPLNSGFMNAVNAAQGLGGSPWTLSTSQAGFLGTGYHYTVAGDGSQRATWVFTSSQSGPHEVFARWTTFTNRASNAPYTISHDAGETTVRVDQRTNGGVWISLGIFDFTSTTDYSVHLTNDADGIVIADGILIESRGTGMNWVVY